MKSPEENAYNRLRSLLDTCRISTAGGLPMAGGEMLQMYADLECLNCAIADRKKAIECLKESLAKGES